MSKSQRSQGWLSCMLAAGVLAVVPATAGQAPAREKGPTVRPLAARAADAGQARVIVKYKASAGLMRIQSAGGATTTAAPQHAATLGQRLGLPLVDGHVLGSHTQALRGSGLSSAALASQLAAQPEVEWVVEDGRKRHTSVPNDPLFAASTSISPAAGQWYLRAPDSTLVAATNVVSAWNRTTGSSAITVAVLDTGVRFDHPDLGRVALAGKLYPGYDFIALDSDGTAETAGDGDGRDSDPSDPGDYVTAGQCGAGEPADNSSWHGTQVSGLIAAATNNSIGMAGSGRDVRVLPVRVLGKCGGYDSDIIAGMRWAGGLSNSSSCTTSSTPSATCNPNVAQVINMSLGGTGSCTNAYTQAISELTAARVSVVVAAGNEAGAAVGTPANCAGAIAVAGLRHAGTKVGYSNLGPEVAIAAPAGNCVNTGANEPCLYPLLTTRNLGTTTPSSNGYSDASNYSVGTSFATPLVAGTVALMLSVNPNLSPAEVRSLLRSTARSFVTTGGSDNTVTACRAPSSAEQLECYCTTSTCGAGMLDANAAVNAVTAAGEVTVNPPTARIVPSATAPTAGNPVSLSGSTSSANGSRTIASYAWTLTAGANLASLSSSSGATVTLNTTAAGTVTVQLTVTDSAGATGTSTQDIAVQAVTSSGGSTGGSSGGGGGGMSALWVALLGLATVVLAWPRRRGG